MNKIHCGLFEINFSIHINSFEKPMLLLQALLRRSRGARGAGANFPVSIRESPLHGFLQRALASTKRNVREEEERKRGRQKEQSRQLRTSNRRRTKRKEKNLQLSFFSSLPTQANELRVGSVIEVPSSDGGSGKGTTTIAQITKYLYTQGSGRQLGVVQATLRDLASGGRSEARWRPGDSVLEARLVEEPATLLYREKVGPRRRK